MKDSIFRPQPILIDPKNLSSYGVSAQTLFLPGNDIRLGILAEFFSNSILPGLA
jgi:hypothetical protein